MAQSRGSEFGRWEASLHFYGAIADLVDGANVHLSISHDSGITTAIVIVEHK